MDCIGSPTRNNVRPSPGDQSCVSVSSRSYWSRDVSWNSSTRMCASRVPSRSASGVGLASLVSASARGAGDLDVITFAVNR